jgi:hypothetical protein
MPGFGAPPMLPGGVTPNAVVSRLRTLDEVQRQVFGWLTSLQALAEIRRFDRDFPGFQYFTFGFIPVGTHTPGGEMRQSGGYTLGIALELESSKVDKPQEFFPIELGGHVFTGVVNRRLAELHVPDPTNPPGTGACWGRSHKPTIRPASEGVLTAEHVVSGRPLGSSVSMSSGGSWHLGDRGSSKLDAALIVQAGSIPNGVRTLGVQMNPAPPTSVTFFGSATGQVVTANITHAMIHPTYLSHQNPMRVFFDAHGKGGDSGALVQEANSGLGVGIYMGVAPVSGTAGEGIAQALSQAQNFLRLDLII